METHFVTSHSTTFRLHMRISGFTSRSAPIPNPALRMSPRPDRWRTLTIFEHNRLTFKAIRLWSLSPISRVPAQFSTCRCSKKTGWSAPSPSSVQQFVDQLDFFEALYSAAGTFGSASNIDLLARGAIYGQMLGIEHESEPVGIEPGGTTFTAPPNNNSSVLHTAIFSMSTEVVWWSIRASVAELSMLMRVVGRS